MKVCFALNGVLANTSGALVDLIRRDLGIVIPPTTFSKALVGKAFPNAIEGSRLKRFLRDGYLSVKKHLFDTNAYYAMPAIAGAVENMPVLIAAGIEPMILTDAKSVSKERVATWLRRRKFPKDLPVIFTRKGRRLREPHQCSSSIIVDDDLDRLMELVGHDELTLIHYMPAHGTAGADAASESTHERVRSVRGWDQLTALLLEKVTASTETRLAA